MNILKTFISLIGICTSQYLKINWEKRPVYISKLINDGHRDGILNAMNQLGLEETENKKENHIRVEYDIYNGGGIEMVAATDYDGFYIYETIIGINRLLNENSFQCCILHELCHAHGLAHRDEGIMKPIINTTDHYCSLSYIEHLLMWQNLLN